MWKSTEEATKHVWKAAPYGLHKGDCCTTSQGNMVERSRQPSAGALTPLVVLQSPSHSSPISLLQQQVSCSCVEQQSCARGSSLGGRSLWPWPSKQVLQVGTTFK